MQWYMMENFPHVRSQVDEVGSWQINLKKKNLHQTDALPASVLLEICVSGFFSGGQMA